MFMSATKGEKGVDLVANATRRFPTSATTIYTRPCVEPTPKTTCSDGVGDLESLLCEAGEADDEKDSDACDDKPDQWYQQDDQEKVTEQSSNATAKVIVEQPMKEITLTNERSEHEGETMSVKDEVKEQNAQLDKLITYYEYCVEEAESKKERERFIVIVSNLRAQKERKDAIESLTRTELSESSREKNGRQHSVRSSHRTESRVP